MFSSLRAIFLHLRLPFSWFLLPIWLVTVCISPNFGGERLGLTFIILHFLLYPASNAFNSYFDRDEGPIGAMKQPPAVNKGVYWISLLLDVAAIWLALKISVVFMLMILGYSLASRAYSHPTVRVKRYPVTGFLYTAFFQGLYTVSMTYIGLNDYPITSVFKEKVLFAGAITSILLMAIYPLTQIYQHAEDARRGYQTISMMLGIRGTFHFAAGLFVIALAAVTVFLGHWLPVVPVKDLFLSLAPAMVYFGWWYWKVRRDDRAADWRSLTVLMVLASTGLNVFFFRAFLLVSNVAQVFS